MAHHVAEQSAEALRAAKRLMRHGQNSSFETIMEMSANAQALMHLSDDHNEAVSAMLEKRPAEYQDK
jgi:2-(1,2-epoxy-1,2-dihydrophenyl)acetyl-CoA isomerase